jgi:SAM-dependent methyltransferase
MHEAHAALSDCAQGILAPGIALMQLCLTAPDEAAARAPRQKAMAAAMGVRRDSLGAVDELWCDTPDAFALVKAVAASGGGEAGGARGIAGWAKAFDAAATISPEASVALYSLGRRDLLAAATDEVVAVLRSFGLLLRGDAILEIGCGIGRFVRALAPEAAHVTGLDVSPVMLAEAGRRCRGIANVRLLQGNGRDFAPLADAAFDLVLSVDAFPYLVAAGSDVVEANMREAHRVLRVGGRLAIFNYSYRGAEAEDRRDIAMLARRIGFRVRRNGEECFRLWEGALFDLERMP